MAPLRRLLLAPLLGQVPVPGVDQAAGDFRRLLSVPWANVVDEHAASLGELLEGQPLDAF